MGFVRNALYGVLAGAVGTCALDVTTYADMTARARPASDLPTKMAATLFGAETDQNRLQGLGALIGYADGLGAGLVFGLLRPVMRGVPWFIAGGLLAAATAVASEGTATALKQTDPTEWGVDGWIADIVPRCVYGWTTCLTFDEMTRA